MELITKTDTDQTFTAFFARAQAQVLIERECTILDLRYGLTSGRQQTQREIGKHFRVTKERIHQLIARSLRRIHTIARLELAHGITDGACAALLLYMERECRPTEYGHLDRLIEFAQRALPHLPQRSYALPLLVKLLCPIDHAEQCLRDLHERLTLRSIQGREAIESATNRKCCPNPPYHQHPRSGKRADEGPRQMSDLAFGK